MKQPKDLKRIQELKDMPYYDYLETKEWKLKALQKKSRAKWKCQLCNSKSELVVHHRTYESVGDEPMVDLTVLCKKCHTMFHTSRELYDC